MTSVAFGVNRSTTGQPIAPVQELVDPRVILSLPGLVRPLSRGWVRLASANPARQGHSMHDLKRALAHVSWKSHENGSRNPKAHLRNRVTIEQVLNAPTISYPLGVYDCCGVSDGAACAIVTTPAIARELGKRDVVLV